MSADIVNLRLARKRRERAEKDEAAAQNRALHGAPKAARTLERKLAATTQHHLDQHRLQPPAASADEPKRG